MRGLWGRWARLGVGVLAAVGAAGCATAPPVRRAAGPAAGYGLNYDRERVLEAESGADAAGRKVLATGRAMATEERVVIPGACWDYANAIYNRAGYPDGRRRVAFKSVKKGPYAKADMIRPGDWLYLVNHASGGIEHSAIFVYWEDRPSMRGMMLTYAGRKREVPARYLEYDLSSVYRVTRPAE